MSENVNGGGDLNAKLKPLVDLVKDDMGRVNDLILSKAHSDVELIPELAGHLIDSGGKRIRPMLTIAAAKLCDYGGEGHIKLATAVEFMHTATLLHDDVVDESDMRRGKAAARLLWGNEASVLVGDFLLGQAFKMMVEVGSLGALAILSNAAAVIAEGEVMQLSAANNIETTEEQYMEVISAKTAELFAAAAEVGAVVAGRSPGQQAALRAYGMYLGVAFQLVDDALDYSGEAAKLGKNVGDDFREGKMTLPVLLAVARGDGEERAFWKQALEGDDSVTDADLAKAVALMGTHDVIAATLDRARAAGAAACEALSVFPDDSRKAALIGAVEFCVNRRH
jgi:octaprenyl-diphosphate synthase